MKNPYTPPPWFDPRSHIIQQLSSRTVRLSHTNKNSLIVGLRHWQRQRELKKWQEELKTNRRPFGRGPLLEHQPLQQTATAYVLFGYQREMIDKMWSPCFGTTSTSLTREDWVNCLDCILDENVGKTQELGFQYDIHVKGDPING